MLLMSHLVSGLKGKGGRSHSKKRQLFPSKLFCIDNYTHWLFRYGIKDRKRHGEAGSVNIADVEAERKRQKKIQAPFKPKDRFNADETAFWPFLGPDRGLSSKQMSGKKHSKFRITTLHCVNADGSEKLPLKFIGRYAQPRCFNGQTPQQLGIDYSANSKAWMNREIFDEWLRVFDRKMIQEDRKVLLTIDNFKGHEVEYKPKNITVNFLAPNLTSFVQPLDAGIIACVKALYRKAICLRALKNEKNDPEGKTDIYKINLLESMRLLEDKWDDVSAETIRNCWKHAGICPLDGEVVEQSDDESDDEDIDMEDCEADGDDSGASSSHTPAKDLAAMSNMDAWEVLQKFAQEEYTLPQAEEALQTTLQDSFHDEDWRPLLDGVMRTETDTAQAVSFIKKEMTKHIESRKLVREMKRPERANLRQMRQLEGDLEKLIKKLQDCHQIRGTPLTVEEFINPQIEQDYEDDPEEYEYDDGTAGIVERVRYEEKVQRGEIEPDHGVDKEEDEGELECGVSNSTLFDRLAELEQLCLQCLDLDFTYNLSNAIRDGWNELRKRIMENAQQTTLEDFFGAANEPEWQGIQ